MGSNWVTDEIWNGLDIALSKLAHCSLYIYSHRFEEPELTRSAQLVEICLEHVAVCLR